VGKEKSKIALKKVDGHSHSFSFTIDNPSLWYPNKQGPQALYEIEFHPMNVGALPTVVKRFGVRTVELIREKDGKEANSKAESFYFKYLHQSIPPPPLTVLLLPLLLLLLSLILSLHSIRTPLGSMADQCILWERIGFLRIVSLLVSTRSA